MLIVYILLAVIAFYFLLIFVILRLITPFLGFGRFRLPEHIPHEITEKIAELEQNATSPNGYAQSAYDFVISRWHAGRFGTIQHAPLAFRNNIAQIWNTPGYAHCNTQNYLLFVLLAGSRFFAPKDIKPTCTMFNLFIHQYLKVTLPSGTISVDPAGASIRGMPYGSHITFFR